MSSAVELSSVLSGPQSVVRPTPAPDLQSAAWRPPVPSSLQSPVPALQPSPVPVGPPQPSPASAGLPQPPIAKVSSVPVGPQPPEPAPVGPHTPCCSSLLIHLHCSLRGSWHHWFHQLLCQSLYCRPPALLPCRRPPVRISGCWTPVLISATLPSFRGVPPLPPASFGPPERFRLRHWPPELLHTAGDPPNLLSPSALPPGCPPHHLCSTPVQPSSCPPEISNTAFVLPPGCLPEVPCITFIQPPGSLAL
ncbi:vegetative cell wall protein gp1-like [Siniperca chuatsi]|uniref:vegetative cell wall protein gp1-like n=1 Tax=Siniperca chuatsi TaxID=119488 RepID=UPI001CE08A07|nr:vegetative cell wall protein gp1-like [Siniperca chuatsi]XP_044055757.1 vegetative cell wall protein gp1-like [Siniperca chuatsi]